MHFSVEILLFARDRFVPSPSVSEVDKAREGRMSEPRDGPMSYCSIWSWIIEDSLLSILPSMDTWLNSFAIRKFNGTFFTTSFDMI